MNIGAASDALDKYNQAREGGDTLETDLIDLITDLLHLAKRRGEDPEAILRTAQTNFEAEDEG